MKKALILVDIQNDFVSGGALAVPEGEEIIPIVNELQKEFDLIIATQDWHPKNHGSFATNNEGKEIGELTKLNGLDQVMWPIHCVQETKGAEFVKELSMENVAKVFVKGTDSRIDSYSGFFDNGKLKATGLGDYLKEQGVVDIYVVGLATDYCVKFTALDGIGLGFVVYLIEDATRGVNLQDGDVQRAVVQMREEGVKIIQSTDIISH